MFSLTIVFGPGPTVWTLMFKTKEAVQTAEKFLTSEEGDSLTHHILEDDFGQKVTVFSGDLHGWMAEDLEQSRLAHIERALHQVRTQAKGAELADADPVLKQARHRAQGGMPMIQPMPAGFGPNGGFRS
jgi:hypothetical protein